MDIESEPVEAKKQTRGSTSTKRSRASEVHNLSERATAGTAWRKPTFRDMVLGTSGTHTVMVQERVDLIAHKLARVELEEGHKHLPKVFVADSVIENLSMPWKEALVIKLLGKNLGYNLMRSKLKALWKPKGGFEILDVDHGVFMVKFDLPDDKENVLKGGPWMIFDRCLATMVRRRDRSHRINEKMRELQELIPRSNKPDNASMLGEAIEYLKSLQMQVQDDVNGMSHGPNVVPRHATIHGCNGFRYGHERAYGTISIQYTTTKFMLVVDGKSGIYKSSICHATRPTTPEFWFLITKQSAILIFLNFTIDNISRERRTLSILHINNLWRGNYNFHKDQTISQPREHMPNTGQDLGNPDNRQFGK
ncbi:hypothetical protein OROGR_027473 [Orobanche gracilis]